MATSLLDDAYERIHAWYKANVGLLDAEVVNDFPRNGSRLELGPDQRARSRDIIASMPDPADASLEEKRAILKQVRAGALEWAYAASNGDQSNGKWAAAALDQMGDSEFSSGQSGHLRPARSDKSTNDAARLLEEALQLRHSERTEEFLEKVGHLIWSSSTRRNGSKTGTREPPAA